jgi:hypothetical protein
MASRPSDFAGLIETVLAERAQAVTFSAGEIEAQVTQLRARVDRLRAAMPARRQVAAALESLPAERRQGWLEGAQSAVKIVLGEAGRSSRILADAARELLPSAPGSWEFPAPSAAAGGFRPEFELMAAPPDEGKQAAKVESLDETTSMSRSLAIEDEAAEPRLFATIRNFPADSPPPVLLIVEEAGEAGGALVIEIDPEIDPEIAAEAGGADGDPRRRLRYEALLPRGAYYAFFGNPRTRADERNA